MRGMAHRALAGVVLIGALVAVEIGAPIEPATAGPPPEVRTCGGLAQLTTDTRFEQVDAPDTSADGNLTVFEDEHGNDNDLYLYDATNQRTTLVSDDGSQGKISDDGTRITFSSDADHTGENPDGSYEVFLWEAEGPTTSQITDMVGTGGNQPTNLSFVGDISGDGSTLSLVSHMNPTGQNADGNREGFLYDIDTASFTQITDTVGPDGAVLGPLTTDGQRMVFESNRNVTGGNPDGNPEIWFYDAGTNDITQVTNTLTVNGRGGASTPDISGDGATIAFVTTNNLTGQNADRSMELFLYDVGTATFTQTTNAFSTEQPTLSGDGNLVVYGRVDGEEDNDPQLFRYNATTGTHTQLTRVTRQGNTNTSQPRMSADGSKVAFISNGNLAGNNAGGNYQLFLFPPSEPCSDGQIAFDPTASATPASTGPAQATPEAALTYKGFDLVAGAAVAEQTRTATIGRGRSRVFWARVHNAGPVRANFRVKGVPSGSAGYTVRFYRGTANISTAVKNGTYTVTNLAPDATVRIRVVITATTNTTAGSARNVDITIKSTTVPVLKDVVRARVTRA